MALPLTTTTVTLLRPTAGADPYEAQSYTTTATGVAATLAHRSVTGSLNGGAQDSARAGAYLPPGTDVAAGDQLTDDNTDIRWTVLAVVTRYELGLGHVAVELAETVGASDG